MMVTTPMISALDLDHLTARFRTAVPFPSICIDDFLEESFANEVAEAYPSFEEAKRLGHGFNAVNERGKYQIPDSSLFPKPIQQLHEALSSQDFLSAMGKMSGIEGLVADPHLIGGGIHQTGPRGHLDVHVDFNYITKLRLHRRLNILVFFNREWQPDWGGNLELWDSDVKTCHHSFEPIFNRCCIFQTSEISFHGVTAVKCPPDLARKSFAAYYYTNETDDSFVERAHSTIFKARPDERLKKNILMPMERLKSLLAKGRRKLGKVLKKK